MNIQELLNKEWNWDIPLHLYNNHIPTLTEWATIPLNKKIKNLAKLLNDIKTDITPFVDRCWITIHNRIKNDPLVNGKQICKIFKAFFQLPGSDKFQKEHQLEAVTLSLTKGDRILEPSLKLALSKDSDYFKSRFGFKNVPVLENKKAEVELPLTIKQFNRVIEAYYKALPSSAEECIEIINLAESMQLCSESWVNKILETLEDPIQNLETFEHLVNVIRAACVGNRLTQEKRDKLGHCLIHNLENLLNLLDLDKDPRPALLTEYLGNIQLLKISKLDLPLTLNCRFIKMFLPCCLNIQELKIYNYEIKDDILQPVLKCKSLRTVKLHSYPVTDEFIKKLSKNGSLQSLSLSSCYGITDNSLIEVINNCDLQVLHIDDNKNITNASINHLAKHCHSLQSLHISSCPEISGHSIKQVIENSSLRSLTINSCKNLTDHDLLGIANHKDLELLNLAWCDQITDLSIREVAKNSKLQSLNISGCKQVTDYSISQIIDNVSLTSLTVRSCPQVTDASLLKILPTSNLKSLCAAFCPDITDIGIIKIAQHTPIKYLTINGCPKVTDHAMIEIAKKPSLRSLSIEDCPNITDLSLKELIRNSSFEDLCVSNDVITDVSIQIVAKIPSLKYLSLNNCTQLTDHSIKALMNHPNLEWLYAWSCPNITNDSLEKLFEHSKIGMLSAGFHGSFQKFRHPSNSNPNKYV